MEPEPPDPPDPVSKSILNLINASEYISNSEFTLIDRKQYQKKKNNKLLTIKPKEKSNLKNIHLALDSLKDSSFTSTNVVAAKTKAVDSIVATENIFRTRYNDSDKGPYIVQVQLIEDSPSSGSTLHPIKFGNFLFKNNMKNILNDGIKRVGRNRLVVHFRTPLDANNFLDNNLLFEANKYKVFIPTYNICRLGVVKGIPSDWSHDDIISNIEVPSGFGKILRTRRVSRKVINNGISSWVPTQSVILTFDGQAIPARVSSFYTSIEVEQYIYPTVQCYNCCRFGHTRVQCRSKPRCYKCSLDHAGDSCIKTSNFLCINCQGMHEASDKICPEYVRQSNIKYKMSRESISYQEAAKEFGTSKQLYAEVVKKPNVISSSPSPPFPNHISPTSPTYSYKKTSYINRKPARPVSQGYDLQAHKDLINEFKLPTPNNGCALNISKNKETPHSDNLNDLLSSLINIITNSSLPDSVAISLINNISTTIYQYIKNGPDSSVEL